VSNALKIVHFQKLYQGIEDPTICLLLLGSPLMELGD
jgi:hypothetical protein